MEWEQDISMFDWFFTPQSRIRKLKPKSKQINEFINWRASIEWMELIDLIWLIYGLRIASYI